MAGIFEVCTGIAIAISSGMMNKLWTKNEETIISVHQCFKSNELSLDLSSGIAGQGLSLLACRDILDVGFFDAKLSEYVRVILLSQLKNGSWPCYVGNRGEGGIVLSFGIAGI